MFWVNSFIQTIKMNEKNKIYPNERSNHIIVKLRDNIHIDDKPSFKTKQKKIGYVTYMGLIQRKSKWR